ncbi:hypothetical protein [uncultured Desulfovibrio sp.]|uniref:hypothetical protein n=1 Tax=uncultured Desulfovibrio sp. TaxID=167968 RepID=UPI00260A2182|nr:hypothetical protein [uncultured Desulfovibrio sp.]
MTKTTTAERMASFYSEVRAFHAQCFTSNLCATWKICMDRITDAPNVVITMARIEDELQRRYPEQFQKWLDASEDDFDAYTDPRRFFSISNSEEARLHPELSRL